MIEPWRSKTLNLRLTLLLEYANIPAEHDIYVGESRTRRKGMMRLIYVNKNADV